MKDIDDLIIVTDPSAMGMRTTSRIIDITKEMTLKVNAIHIIANRFSEEAAKVLYDKFPEGDEKVSILGTLPEDPAIQAFNLEGKPLLEIDDTNPVYMEICSFMRKIGL